MAASPPVSLFSSHAPGLFVAAMCLALAALVAPGALDANSRDSDGSRMQARKIAFPSSHKDSLEPPNDSVDWRFFKLTEETSVSVKATFANPKSGATIRLLDASGDELASASARGGQASVSKQVDAGVYYISASASSKTGYSLSLR